MKTKCALVYSRVNPAVHNIITDWTNAPGESMTAPCGDLELRALECIEYYGRQRGYVICKDVYDDFTECRLQRVQVQQSIKHSDSFCGFVLLVMPDYGIVGTRPTKMEMFFELRLSIVMHLRRNR